MDGREHYPLPELDETIDLHERVARCTNPLARCVGISVKSRRVAIPDAANAALLVTHLEQRTN
ncbi:MAG: hypothetical protein WB812_07475 [Woeseiaceae bacterium]